MEGFNINNLITPDKKTIENGGGEAKKTGGRPKSKEPKSQKVMTYFTEKEKKILVELAESRDLSLSNFIRISALEKIN